MSLTGELFIGFARAKTNDAFSATDPSTGETLAPLFSAAGPDEIDRACALAATAYRTYAETGLEARAQFLERIGDEIMALGDDLLERAMAETGLPLARLTGERGRTVGQLKLFAAEIRDGAWLGLRFDPALPDRAPLPRPDLRTRKKALGPVAIFGASNFPLAFSVAGGDTASALAAGCPIVVKGHPAHPGTCELVASAIVNAAQETGMPEGVFAMLNGPAHALGGRLVADPRIKAVGFTGSRQGGLALMKIAAERDEPIPVYAEMSAVNPVILMPGALKDNAAKLGADFIGSLTMGAGQFCTNPGLLFAVDGPDLDAFVAAATTAAEGSAPQVMLTEGIHKAYEDGVARLAAASGVATLARGGDAEGCNLGRTAFFSVSADDFISDKNISHEVFGASSVLVRCPDAEALARALERLEGQLTVTLQMTDEDTAACALLTPILEDKAGRLIVNGWPTGVEVCHAMVHGGPFPATSDARTTSVGTLAIDRWVRPICYQNFPEALLPAALKDKGPDGVMARIDGAWKLG